MTDNSLFYRLLFAVYRLQEQKKILPLQN